MRPAALIAAAALVVTGLVVAPPLIGDQTASAAGVISTSADTGGAILAGETSRVELSASNPVASGSETYNLSFSLVLPPDVAYTGPTTRQQGGVTVTLPDPTIVEIMTPGPDPVVDHLVLLWQNVSDLGQGVTETISFGLTPDPVVYPVGSTIPFAAGAAGAYANTDPRIVPRFDATGAIVPGSATDDATTDPAAIRISAIELTKSEPSPESELMRGVHDQVTEYTLAVRVTDQGDVADAVVVDWLPANLEFLGCGGVDHTSGTTVEYVGAPRLSAGRTIDDCVAPASVETVSVPTDDPQPGEPTAAGVYTRVTWNVGTIEAGRTVEIRYLAGVPLFENTMTWPDGEPATTGEQGSNLDNNSGPSTRQGAGADVRSAVNHARADADYLGPIADDGDPAQFDEVSHTVHVSDLSVVKSVVGDTEFVAGAVREFELLIRTSEYTSASSIRLEDIIPSGTCPLVPAGWGGTYPASAPAGCEAANAVTGAEVTGVTHDTATGTFGLTLVPAAVAPETEPGSAPVNAEFTVRYGVLMLSSYTSADPDPTVSGDSFLNGIDIVATTHDVTATDPEPSLPGVEDDSAATLQTAPPTIEKRVAERPVPASTAVDCSAIPATGYLAEGEPVYQAGDRICFQLTVNFSTSTLTRDAQLQDFLPVGVTYGGFSVVPGGPAVELVLGAGNAPVFRFGVENPDANDDSRYVPRAATSVIHLWGTVGDTMPTTEVDLKGNLMKYRQLDTEGRVLSLRDDVDFGVLPPVLTLGKSASATQVAGGQTVTFTLPLANTSAEPFDAEQIVIWDALPAGFDCADVVVTAAHAMDCVLPTDPSLTGSTLPAGTEGVITWLVAGPLAAGTPLSPALSYDVVVPQGLGVNLSFTNVASVVAFTSPNTAGGDTPYAPESSLKAAPTGGYTSPRAEADATVSTPDTSIAKTATPVPFAAPPGPDPGLSATQVVAGQKVVYTYSATVPAGTAIFGGVLSDALPSLVVTASGVPTGATVTAEVPGVGTISAGSSAAGFSLSAAGVLTFPAVHENTGTTPQVFTVTIANATISPAAVQGSTSAGTAVTNTATLASTATPGGTARSKTAQAAVNVRSLSPSVTKAATPNTGVTGGTTVTFTITAANASGRPGAYDARIVDCLPADFGSVVFTATPSGVVAAQSPVTATGDADGCAVGTTKLTWTWPSTQGIWSTTPTADRRVEFTSVVQTTPTAGGSVTNTAALTASSLPDGARDTAIEQVISVTGNRQIAFGSAGSTKQITAPAGTPALVTQGETVSYRATVTLQPGLAYPQLTIRDTLPTNTTLVGPIEVVSCVDAASAACTGIVPGAGTMLTPSGQTVGLLLGDVAAHTSARTITVEYEVLVSSTATLQRNDPLTNTVRASWRTPGAPAPTSAADGQFSHDGTQSTATARVKLPLLTVDKAALNADGTAAVTTAQPGDTLTYTIDVANALHAQGSTAELVVVTDTVPVGLVVDSGSVSPPPASIAGGGSSPTVITWNLDPIANGAEAPTLSYRVGLTDSSLLGGTTVRTNTVSVAYATLSTGGRTMTPVTDTATVALQFPAVTTTKALTSSTPSYLDEAATWTLTLTNGGTGTAASVTPTDTLPTNWTFGSATLSIAGSTPVPFAPTSTTGGVIQWPSIGALPAGQSATIFVTATPSSAVVTNPGVGSSVVHRNTVSAVTTDANGATGKGTPGQSYTGAPGTADARIDSADVRVTKTAATTGVAGTTVGAAWQITVSNASGGDTAVGPFVVTDTPGTPGTGLTIGVPSGAGWSCGLVSGGPAFTCERQNAAETLAPGASFPVISVPVAIAADAEVGASAENHVEVAARTYDPNETNNEAEAEFEVTAAQASLTLVKDAVAPFTAGQDAVWTLDVRNTGPSVARFPIVITDTLPASGIGAAVGEGTDWSCTTTGAEIVCTYGSAGGSLAVGDALPPITVTAPVLSDATGTLHNEAIAASQTPYPPLGPGVSPPWEDETDTPIGAVTALSVEKDAIGEFVAGDPIDFTFTVTNTGTPVARDVTLTDPLPAEMTVLEIVSAPGWDCSATVVGSSAIDCALDDPLPGTGDAPANAVVVQVRVAVPEGATGSIVNTATAGWGNCATAPCETTGSWTNTPGIETDLEVVKTGPTTAEAGTSFDYTITVTNLGPSTAPAGVVLADVVPSPLEVLDLQAPAWWDCDPDGIACESTEAMLSGDDAEFTVTVGVPSTAAAGPIDNTATVAPAPGTVDPVTSNNTSTWRVAITTRAEVTIEKTGPASAAPGTSIEYTLTVVNAGPSVARSAVVTDTPPTGVTITGMTAADADPVAWSCTVATAVCTVETLPVGTSEIVVTAEIDSSVADATELVNEVEIVWTDSRDDAPHRDEDEWPVIAVTDAELVVDKTTSTPSIDAGEQATFSLLVSNAGPSDQPAGAVIVDALPTGMTFVSASSVGDVWTATPTATGVELTLSTAIPAGGSAVPVEIVVATDPALGWPTSQTLVNSAVVQWVDGTGGGTSPESTADVEIGSRSDVSVTKEHDPTAVRVGDPLPFVLTVANDGPSAAVGVTVTDTLPAALEYVGVDPSTSADWSCEPDADDPRQIDCALAQPIAPGLSAPPLVLVVLVTADAYPATVNTVTVAAANDPDEPVLVEDPVAVPALVNLVPTKEHVGEFIGGGTATYDITVTNEGPTPTDAYDEETGTGGFQLVDTMPAGLAYTGFSGDADRCEADGTEVTCFFEDALEVGGTLQLRLTAAIDRSVVGEIVNVVEARTDAEQIDPDPEAHRASAAAVVAPAPPLPWTGQPIGPILVIGMLAIIAMLGGTLLVLRRRTA